MRRRELQPTVEYIVMHLVLATFPLLAGLPKASLLFDLVFFVVLVSVLLQGASAPFVARWLGVITPAAVAQETKTG